MNIKQLFSICFVFFVFPATAQHLRINPNIRMPKDSLESNRIINALDSFLTAAQQPNEQNKFIQPEELPETYVLLDEVRDMPKSGQFKDEQFYQPYLTNIVPLKDHQYRVRVAYIGTHDNTSMLRADFEFIAYPSGNSFLFASPLIYNTRDWKTEKIGNHIFHYRNTLDKAKAEAYTKRVNTYDQKLKAKNTITEFYCCEDFAELGPLTGMHYKADYNGRAHITLNTASGNRVLSVRGNDDAHFGDFDPHDLWHERLGMVADRRQTNRPVDEGCAYLYGGSWGLSWKDIFTAFCKQVADAPGRDWTTLKETPLYFKTKEFNNNADYIVNALLVQKIEREKGFSGVWTWLNCGKAEPGNANYYQALAQLTGITQTNYNEKITELIRNEKKRLHLM